VAALSFGPASGNPSGRFAALQKHRCCYANKLVATGIWHTYSALDEFSRVLLRRNKERALMSKTASLGIAPSATLIGRLMANLDRLLMTSAGIAIRNGDLPYFGL
jgi:hypothetical protein